MARLDGAARWPLGMSRGRDFSDTIEIEGDLTADTFTGQVRAYPDAPGDPILSFTVGSPTLIDGVTTVALSIPVSALASASLPISFAGSDIELAYDIKRVSGGIAKTFLYGPFTIHGSVTQ